METLADGLQKELKRNRELLCEYKNIGWSGQFGAAIIEKDIQAAETAILENNIIAMVSSYKDLQENK